MTHADYPRRRRAFTYIELLAMLAILDNLLLLRNALDAYAGDNHHDFPRTTYDPALNANGYTAFTGPYAGNPFSVAVGPNDATASLWLLVRKGYVKDLSIFVCPSSRQTPDSLVGVMGEPVNAEQRSNFRSSANLSYSYASPFSGYADYRLNSDALPAQFATMADKNPGSSAALVPHDASPLELARGNSLNHQRAGQNVLYADGSASFQVTPYCGVGRDTSHPDGDNIYTALAAKPLTPGDSPFYAGNGFCGRQYGPSYQYDTFLVPTEEDGP
jgi:hypothetical protein